VKHHEMVYEFDRK